MRVDVSGNERRLAAALDGAGADLSSTAATTAGRGRPRKNDRAAVSGLDDTANGTSANAAVVIRHLTGSANLRVSDSSE